MVSALDYDFPAKNGFFPPPADLYCLISLQKITKKSAACGGKSLFFSDFLVGPVFQDFSRTQPGPTRISKVDHTVPKVQSVTNISPLGGYPTDEESQNFLVSGVPPPSPSRAKKVLAGEGGTPSTRKPL